MNINEAKLPLIGHSEYTNVTKLIHSGPCIVKSVHVACCGSAGYAWVYDGLNNQGKFKAYLALADAASYNWTPGEGTDFNYGIYVIVNAATTHVTVTYIPESWKDFI